MKVDPSIGAMAGADRREDLRRAAEEFEALFLQTLVHRMAESQLTDGFFGSATGSSVYEGMFEQFVADELASRSPLGIARMLEARWSDGAADETSPAEARSILAVERAGVAYRAVMEGSAAAPARGPAVARAAGAAADRFSRGFGWGRDPIDGRSRFHGGVDIPAPAGTPVRALAAGRVSEVGDRGGYGLRVEVEHAGEWATTYSHLAGADVVPGQPVARGQRIGAVGDSGRSTGPHLHFETLRGGRKVDPGRATHAPLPAQVLGESAEELDERGRNPLRR